MTSFRLFAGTDVGLRGNNEDNFTVNPDLTHNDWIIPIVQPNPILLGERGCLIVVADGMGGMNAGEVASDIAINTVQQMFSPETFPADIMESPVKVKAFLKDVIVQADLQIKRHCKEDPSTEGMGSTIVMAWLIEDNVYVGWLGDSRAYSYIPNKGISRLSKDHSYVQELVDAKMITEEEAMFHPQSNVITRSLGDVTQKAKPGIVCHHVIKNEIILLCTDGLCGVCPDTAIAQILFDACGDLKKCKEVLTDAALESDGSDNITIALLQIVDIKKAKIQEDKHPLNWKSKYQNLLSLLFAIFIVLSLVFAGLNMYNVKSSEPRNKQGSAVIPKDSSGSSEKALGDEGKGCPATIGKKPEKGEDGKGDAKENSPLSDYMDSLSHKEDTSTSGANAPTPSQVEGENKPDEIVQVEDSANTQKEQ